MRNSNRAKFQIVAVNAIFALAITGIAAVVGLMMTQAQAHEAPPSKTQPLGWTYGWECCSNMDCSQQQQSSISEGPDGYTVKETGEVISYGDKRIKRSKDEFYHRCTHGGDPKDPKSICLYVPDRGL